MRELSDLGKDLREFLHRGKEKSKMNLAREILQVAAELAPLDTGRLQSSGFSYVDGKLVSQTKGMGGEGPVFTHHSPKAEEDLVEFVFSTPKAVGEGGKVYYSAGGGKWFDYALYVANKQKGWTEIAIDLMALNIIDETFRKLW